jgi:hypothetical protein
MSDIETVQQVKIGKDQIIILNKNNYVEWKESFENLSMNYSDGEQELNLFLELQI